MYQSSSTLPEDEEDNSVDEELEEEEEEEEDDEEEEEDEEEEDTPPLNLNLERIGSGFRYLQKASLSPSSKTILQQLLSEHSVKLDLENEEEQPTEPEQ